MSEYTISFDPGLRHAGVSVFDGSGTDARLVYATLARNSEKTVRGLPAWAAMAVAACESVKGYIPNATSVTFVSEIPQIYRGPQQKGDQDDLLQLAGVVGAVAGALGASTTVSYYPREWGGQTPKEIKNRRTLARLEDGEKKNIAAIPQSLLHNTLDSIGIGLYHLGRYR